MRFILCVRLNGLYASREWNDYILMMLNKILILWFSFNVTTSSLYIQILKIIIRRIMETWKTNLTIVIAIQKRSEYPLFSMLNF